MAQPRRVTARGRIDHDDDPLGDKQAVSPETGTHYPLLVRGARQQVDQQADGGPARRHLVE